MKQISLYQQLAILAFGLITFNGWDYNLIAISVVLILNALKQPENPPCKVYDFMEYKAKKDALKRKVSYQKAA